MAVPIAHIGYFRREFVERRRWLDDTAFTDFGLCQFLPGPSSSQLGFGIGLLRAGWVGGLAAWSGFTLPSVLLLIVFASIALNPRGLRRSPTNSTVRYVSTASARPAGAQIMRPCM